MSRIWTGSEYDNRTSEDVYQYLEARIESMKRRIQELEQENAELQARLNWRLQHEAEREGMR